MARLREKEKEDWVAEVLLDQGKILKEAGRLDEANRLKSEILRLVAHDLRNPLGGVIGLLEQFHEFGSAEQPDIVAAADREARAALDLLEHLLDFSAVEEGNLRIARETCSFRELLQSVRRGSLARQSEEKGQAVVESECAGDLQMELDPRRCTQILENLFSNAIKYSPPGSTIHYGSRFEGNSLLFWIQDEGPGIPPEFEEVIFKPFHKVPTSVPTGG